jgi:hypothetical protein
MSKLKSGNIVTLRNMAGYYKILSISKIDRINIQVVLEHTESKYRLCLTRIQSTFKMVKKSGDIFDEILNELS